MPFWNPFRKTTLNYAACKSYEAILRLATNVRFHMSESSKLVNVVTAHSGDHNKVLPELIQPQTSNPLDELFDELLASLWQDDPIVLLLIHAVLVKNVQQNHAWPKIGKNVALDRDLLLMVSMVDKDLLLIASMSDLTAAALPEMYFMRELQAFIRKQAYHCPENCKMRYEAVVAGLRACLLHNIQEIHQTDEVFPLDYLFDCLKISVRLKAHDSLYDIFCEMLITTKQIILAERDGPRIARLETLRRELHTFMFWSSHKKANLWQMLKDPATSEVFWPVVDMMQSSWVNHLVPQLLDVLPFLSDDGKTHVVAALDSIGDAAALPALQQLAQEKTSPVAPLAAKAVKSILRRSKGDVAQLLRAADTQQNANAGESLLRPAGDGSSFARPEELLRPDLTE